MTPEAAEIASQSVQFNRSLMKYHCITAMRDILYILYVFEGMSLTFEEIFEHLDTLHSLCAVRSAMADLRRQNLRGFTVSNGDLRRQYSIFV